MTKEGLMEFSGTGDITKTNIDDENKSIVGEKNLIVSPAPLRFVYLRNVEDLKDIINRAEKYISALFWNENGIQILTRDTSIYISYRPEYDKTTTIFFSREIKRRSMFDDNPGALFWEGEFEPVEFGKRELLKFLSEFSSDYDPEIADAIRDLKVSHELSIHEQMDDGEYGRTRFVEERYDSTNIPKKFDARLPLFDGYDANLQFEAKIKKKRGESRNIIEIRCTNARDIIRETMKKIINDIPNDIPKYFGAMNVQNEEKKDRYY